MEDWELEVRLYKLLNGKTSLEEEVCDLLLEEYAQDKTKGIPPEESQARNLLVMGNEGLIRYVLFNRVHIDFRGHQIPDLEEFSVGKLGLINAVDKYDKSLGKFSTFATTCITHEIKRYFIEQSREYKKANTNPLSFNEVLIKDLHGDITVEDRLGEEDEYISNYADIYLAEIAKSNFKYLTTPEQIAISSYCDNRPTEGRKQMGVSRQRYSKALETAINKLRLLMTADEDLDKFELGAKHNLLEGKRPTKARVIVGEKEREK